MSDDLQVLLACPGCGWSGIVILYDIGDGPEWCCSSCDMCWPSKPEVGPDGKTGAQRNMEAAMAEALAARELRWNPVRRSGIVDGDAERGEPEPH